MHNHFPVYAPLPDLFQFIQYSFFVSGSAPVSLWFRNTKHQYNKRFSKDEIVIVLWINAVFRCLIVLCKYIYNS